MENTINTLIIDGDYLVHRHVRTPDKRTLKSSKLNIPTGVTFGVLSSVLNFLEDLQRVDRCIFITGSRQNWRKELDPTYKKKPYDPVFHSVDYAAGEEFSSSDMMSIQLPIIKKLLYNLGVRVVDMDPFEADDIAAYSTKFLLNHTQSNIVLLSDDFDYLQAITWDSKRVSVYRPIKDTSIDGENFLSIMGVPASQYIIYKSILGDTSDLVPGVVKGLGEVWTKRLIEKANDICLVNPLADAADFLDIIVLAASESKHKATRLLAEKENVVRLHRNIMLMDWDCIPFHKHDMTNVEDKIYNNRNIHNPEVVEHILDDLEIKSIKSHILDSDFFKFLV